MDGRNLINNNNAMSEGTNNYERLSVTVGDVRKLLLFLLLSLFYCPPKKHEPCRGALLFDKGKR